MDKLTVRDLMSGNVVAIRPEDDLLTLQDLLQNHNIRHVPVVDGDGRLVGLVTHRDLLRRALIEQSGVPDQVERALLHALKAEEVMTREVMTAEPGLDIRTAAQLMFEHKYGCLPVVDGERLVGILTEADFVRFLAGGN